ncbi:hypothetical protein [Oceanisphaera sp. W20_SRM_FM3]|uniref:hypothetical protein n=1 Tax=Oceanisphaera sp. W20_SRM_FM3 TaxID=3240267 RepID=UPI003F9AB3C5
MKLKKTTIKIRKGVITGSLLAALWVPLLASAASIDKHADKPSWMDWSFFGNTVISAGLTRWHSKRED